MNKFNFFYFKILMCVRSLLRTDKDLEVRRCAVMVISLLLQGVGKDIFQVKYFCSFQ